MNKILIWSLITLGVFITPVIGQTPILDDIDFTPIPSIVVGTTPGPYGLDYHPVFFVDEKTTTLPHGSVHIANFDAQCLQGNKNCKVPLKVYRIE
jgi:hypothetical protein